MVHAVSAEFLLIAFEKSDPFRIGTPLRSRATARVASGVSCFSVAPVCFGDVKLRGRITIRIVRVITHESDASSVRRPRRRALIPFAFGESLEFFRLDIVDVDVCVTPESR
jgi:hypothetical protein